MDNDSYLLDTFAHPEAENLWKDCCHAAQKCCEKIKISTSELQQISQEKGKLHFGVLNRSSTTVHYITCCFMKCNPFRYGT